MEGSLSYSLIALALLYTRLGLVQLRQERLELGLDLLDLALVLDALGLGLDVDVVVGHVTLALAGSRGHRIVVVLHLNHLQRLLEPRRTLLTRLLVGDE
eukprot:40330-Eustigmatos_ZCMA.PRE.1